VGERVAANGSAAVCGVGDFTGWKHAGLQVEHGIDDLLRDAAIVQE